LSQVEKKEFDFLPKIPTTQDVPKNLPVLFIVHQAEMAM
jgi:hypothetical protein